MMKTTVVYYIVVLTVLSMTLSCSYNNSAKVMDEAEKIVYDSPDSALVLLSAIDKYGLSKEERARYGLLFTMAQDKSGINVDMDTLIRRSYIYYKGMPKTKYYGFSQYYMGKYYMLNDSAKEAEDCFRHAIRNANTRGDIELQCLTLEKLSRNLTISNPKLAVEYAQKAYETYRTFDKRTHENTIYYALNVGNCYIFYEKKDSALKYLWIANGMVDKDTNGVVAKDIYQTLCRAHYYFDNADSALHYSRKVLKIVKNSYTIYTHALCLKEKDSLSTAEEILRQYAIQSDAKSQYAAYANLCNIVVERTNNQQLKKDFDSLQKYTAKEIFDLYALKGKYFEDNIKQGKELERQEHAILIRNYAIGGIAVIVILVSIILYMMYSKKRAVQKQEARFLEREHKILVESKNKQIALMKSHLFERLELAKKIQSAKKEKSHVLVNDNDWKQLYTILEGGDDYFVSRLTSSFPNINEDDIHLCMLIKIGLSNEDLSNIYSVTADSIKKKLYCFKEKLNITDRNISLREYIQDF